jgi:quercetin dioxygenase-like cupin family protein
MVECAAACGAWERAFDAATDGGNHQGQTGLDGIVWNILGQTYVPKSLSEQCFSWHATFPPGTFVPPHIHPTQDEFIYMLDGRFDFVLDGSDFVATTGDLIRLPMNIPHGIFNKSDQTVKCFFWVTPTRRLCRLPRRPIHLALREARRAGVAAHDRLAVLVGQHFVDVGEAVGRARSTTSITPSGPPLRFICTICAVGGRRSCS